MEMRITLDYEQLLKLIHQLPPEKFEKLALTLQAELKAKQPTSKEALKQLLLEAPTWSAEQLADYKAAREFINNSRLK